MKNSLLIELLKSLSKNEFRELEKFIDSAYYKRRRDLTGFFKILKKYYPHFSENKISKENIFSELYPGIKYEKKKDNLIRMLSSEMLNLCEDYLVYIELSKNKYARNNLLISGYLERNLDRHIKRPIDEGTRFKNEPGLSMESLPHIIDFFSKCNTYFASTSEQQIQVNGLVNESNEYLISFFLYQISVNFHEHEVNRIMFNQSYNHDFYKELLEKINYSGIIKQFSYNNKTGGIIKLFSNCIMVLLNPENEEYYFEFKKMAEDEVHKYSFPDKTVLYSILRSLTIFKMHKVDLDKYGKIYFDISEEMLSKGMFNYEDNDMTVLTFVDFIGSGKAYRGIEWVENFTEKYINKVPEEHRKNMYHYAYAHLNYFKITMMKRWNMQLKSNTPMTDLYLS